MQPYQEKSRELNILFKKIHSGNKGFYTLCWEHRGEPSSMADHFQITAPYPLGIPITF